jgi:hypothetical protein
MAWTLACMSSRWEVLLPCHYPRQRFLQAPTPEPETVQGDRDRFVSNPAQDGFSGQTDTKKTVPTSSGRLSSE